MAQPKISVIVPVYKVEAELCRCIDSLLRQTLTDFELILVDDGSPDKCPEICDRYAQNDRRIVVIHKENGGLSDARNVGIDRATGEYITFVDSDDYVRETYLEYLYGLISEYGCDMSVCTHDVLYADGKSYSHGNDFRGVLTSEQALFELLYHKSIDTSAWAKMYRKSLFDGIRFPKGKLFEDTATVYLLIDKAGKIANGGGSQYYYVIRDDSIVTMSFSDKKLELLEITDRLAEFVTEKYPSLGQAALRRRVYARFSTLNQMLNVRGFKHERSQMISFIKNNSRAVMKDKNAPKRDKAAIYLLYMGWNVYRIFWKWYCKIFK